MLTPLRLNLRARASKSVANTRVCVRCNKELPISEFYSPPSGFRFSCKKCDLAFARKYQQSHPSWWKEYLKDYAKDNPRRRWAVACLAGHRRRGFAIGMSAEELYQLAAKADHCYICGTELNWQLQSKGRIKSNSPSLDRLDNERALRSDNVSILCYRCNATKRDRTLREFVRYCADVAAKFHSHLE